MDKLHNDEEDYDNPSDINETKEELKQADNSYPKRNLKKIQHEDFAGYHDESVVRHTFADFRKDPTKMKTKAILYIILSIIGVVYTFICFITGCFAYDKIGKNPLALSNIIHNWQTQPIISIKIVDDSEE